MWPQDQYLFHKIFNFLNKQLMYIFDDYILLNTPVCHFLYFLRSSFHFFLLYVHNVFCIFICWYPESKKSFLCVVFKSFYLIICKHLHMITVFGVTANFGLDDARVIKLMILRFSWLQQHLIQTEHFVISLLNCPKVVLCQFESRWAWSSKCVSHKWQKRRNDTDTDVLIVSPVVYLVFSNFK